MKIDPGLAVVLIAISFFYLRLFLVQRERARRVAKAQAEAVKKKKSGNTRQQKMASSYSILSRNRADLAIAGAGMLAILCGVLLNAQWVSLPAWKPYWWLPTAAGIIAFSQAFKL